MSTRDSDSKLGRVIPIRPRESRPTKDQPFQPITSFPPYVRPADAPEPLSDAWFTWIQTDMHETHRKTMEILENMWQRQNVLEDQMNEMRGNQVVRLPRGTLMSHILEQRSRKLNSQEKSEPTDSLDRDV
jgi:hypothetical protein